MHTETNLAEGPNGDEAVYWLWKEWANVLRVRNDGIPIVGFTWYSLTDQVDWDTALREMQRPRQPARPLRPRPQDPAGRRGLPQDRSRDWGDVLPTQSVCLRVPVFPPSESEWALRKHMRADEPPVEAPATAPSTSDGGH